MRKMVMLALLVTLAFAGATAALATHKPGHLAKPAKAQRGKPKRIQVCHRRLTLSMKNPTVTIRVRERYWKAHQRPDDRQGHQAHGDIRGACEATGEPTGFTRTEAQLIPVEGATGFGWAVIDVKVGKKAARLCYTLGIGGFEVAGVHIDTSTDVTLGGTSYAAGSIVVRLHPPRRGGSSNSRHCRKASNAVGEALISSTANFSVNAGQFGRTGVIVNVLQGTLALSS